MTGSLDALLAAILAFVFGHMVLSSAPVRTPLAGRLGENAFLSWYSAVMGVLFVWIIFAYRDAPFVELWQGGTFLSWLPAIFMPVALFLFICGITTPNPTVVGADALTIGRDPTQGIMRITRHPFLNGVALWALLHIAANGDVASLILFAGMFALAAGGMWHIDRKKEAKHGADWGPVLLTTSAVPFLALLQGRATFDWPGIGLWRVAVTIIVYLVLLGAHPRVFGVSAWPGVSFG